MCFNSMAWALSSQPQKPLQLCLKLEMNMIYTEASQDSRSSAVPKGTGFYIGKHVTSHHCNNLLHAYMLKAHQKLQILACNTV